MKYIITAIFLFTVGLVNAQAPGSISLNVYGGYTFKDRVNLDVSCRCKGWISIWRVAWNISFGGTSRLELKYMRMDTQFPLYGPGGNQLNTKTDGSVNFVLLGGNNYFAGTTDKKPSICRC